MECLIPVRKAQAVHTQPLVRAVYLPVQLFQEMAQEAVEKEMQALMHSHVLILCSVTVLLRLVKAPVCLGCFEHVQGFERV